MSEEINDWLMKLQNAGLREDFPPLVKGCEYNLTFELTEHPELGDFSTGTFEMEVKSELGLAAPVLATPTMTSGTVSGGVNPTNIRLSVAAQGSIPDPAATGVINLVSTILYTPPGGSKHLVRGGLLPVLAGVTS